MRNYWFRALLILPLVAVCGLFFTVASAGTVPANSEAVSLEGVAPGQVDSVLAMLSDEQVRSLLGTSLATVLLLLVAGVVFINRKPVAEAILAGCEEDGEESWVMQMFASLWHVLVLCYLFIVWFFMLFQRMQGQEQERGAFLFSLLLIPAFLIMNWLAKWVIRSVVHTMRIYDPSSIPDDENLATAIAEQETKKRLLIRRIQRGARILILAALGAWGLRLWGYRLPYAAEITGAVFDSLVTLVLALMFWRFASGYIERKIKEATPEEEENKEEDDERGLRPTGAAVIHCCPWCVSLSVLCWW